MTEPRLFLCGGASAAKKVAENENRHLVALDASGSDANVTIKIQDVARVSTRDVSGRLVDLLEIAAYVFAGDAQTRRGSKWEHDSIEPWRRDLRFVIPVRDLQFWQQAEVVASLTSTVNFLSDDHFSFEFVAQKKKREIQGYLDFGEEKWPSKKPERVILFSGGLDSLAGAVETAASDEPLVLVSHRPVAQISSRQRKLVQALKAKFSSASIVHVPVWVNKSERFHHEPTQRTRSFLFASLALSVAELVGANGLTFYENGIVSLNLPVADEAIRARSSRTTHPLALQKLASFLSLVAGRVVPIDNPFLHKTKAEVVASIRENGAGALIGHTVSCAHTMFKSKSQQHCGTCSQCIDRRLAVLAVGASADDPDTDYVCDVFLGARKEGYERNMAVHYARHATELARMTDEQFATLFNLEVTRAVRGADRPDAAARAIYELHQRHAIGVMRVLAEQLAVNSPAIVARTLPPTSMLGLIAGQQHERSMWESYCDRIGSVLQAGLPRACATHKPETEPHLQEIADGILAASDADLVREFPFMRWSASATKPDWSSEPLGLWVELKYVRTKGGIRQITEDIAADITKYGDNGRRVLFVVYDPNHLVTDEANFSEPILARDTMRVRFIR